MLKYEGKAANASDINGSKKSLLMGTTGVIFSGVQYESN